VTSSIISTILLAVLSGNNVEEQCITIGCQQAIHRLRSALSIIIAHDIYTYVLFVDLVKAYYTVNHALLFGILKKYGIPEELVEAVEIIYKDCKVHVQLGKEKRTIDYLTGVQQGGNVEPVLFLFLMLAVSETMKKNRKYNTPPFEHFKSNKWNRSGRLKDQNYQKKGDLLEMFHLSHYKT
jgi:hypothetical protein